MRLLKQFLLKYPDYISYLLLATMAGALFWTAPRSGDFWWSEAPRNALNGAFVLDFIKAMPLASPMQWAQQYYYQYPALTILFYPPMLHFFLAGFYALFGVSHNTAVICLSFFSFALAAGLYSTARRLVSRSAALAGALLFFSAPEVVTWAQQIMLEIPMMAFAVWSSYFLLRYCDLERSRDLIASAVLMVAALYTKQIAGVIAVALAAALLIRSPRIVLNRSGVVTALCSIASLIPLIVMQLKFGSFNVTSVVDRADVNISRYSFGNLVWYLRRLPEMMGWAFFLPALGGLVLLARQNKTNRPGSKIDYAVHGCWFGIGYLAMTYIHLKETRHGIFLLVPLATAAAVFVDRLAAGRFTGLAAPVIAGLLFVLSVVVNAAPRIGGYNTAADAVVRRAPVDARVLFAGNQDGNFIFNVRRHENRSDIHIIRADKLFLNIVIMPDLGLNPKELSRDQVRQTLNDLGISYVVTVPNAWTEAKPMRHLAEILASPGFREVERVPLTGSHQEHQLIIYQNLSPLPEKPVPFDMELGAIGLSIKSKKP